MYTLTKIALMWERLGEVIKDVAGIHKTIDDNKAYTPPAYSSTDEVNTGQKWKDGKYIYFKVFDGTTSDSQGSQTIGSISNYGSLVSISGTLITSEGVSLALESWATPRVSSTGSVLITVPSQATLHNIPVIIIVYYTKADPEPAPGTHEDAPIPTDKGTGMITGEDPATMEEVQETKTKRTTKKKEDK